MISKRKMVAEEQPGVLLRGLQYAVAVEREEDLPTRDGPVFAIPHLLPQKRVGVPHGVKGACVYAWGVEVKNNRIDFSPSSTYRVLQPSIQDGCDGEYPSKEDSEISTSCEIPPNGFYNVEMTVSVTSNVHVRIEKFEKV